MAHGIPKRNYASGTVNALIALSQGRCYFPGCLVPVVVFVNEKPRMNVQIVHIHGLKEGAARFDPVLSVPERNAFKNLALMCIPHHTTVDQEEASYPPELLRKWKGEREAGGIEALTGLAGLTERRLEELIGQAMQIREDQIDQALDRLKKIDRSAAQWLDQLRIESAAMRRRPPLDEGLVRSLERVARDLRKVLDEGVINKLTEAAKQVRS
jgi:hypothetical protein